METEPVGQICIARLLVPLRTDHHQHGQVAAQPTVAHAVQSSRRDILILTSFSRVAVRPRRLPAMRAASTPGFRRSGSAIASVDVSGVAATAAACIVWDMLANRAGSSAVGSCANLPWESRIWGAWPARGSASVRGTGSGPRSRAGSRAGCANRDDDSLCASNRVNVVPLRSISSWPRQSSDQFSMCARVYEFL